MSKKIFVNLPVKNLQDSINFYLSLGYSVNKQFTDENAACIVISDDIFLMILVEPFFKSFSKLDVADTKSCNEVIISISLESKDEVNDIVNKAILAGGTYANDATDHGFMYEWGFKDLDGHNWGFFYMNPSHINKD